VKRRELLALAGGAIALPAAAQDMPRVGFLISGDPEPAWTLFRNAMADRGYAEGSGVSYEFRAGPGDSGPLEALAQSMIDRKVDVIVAALTPAVAAARARTATIPIVFYAGGAETSTVDNMARPGANATGVVSASSTLAGKALQAFVQARPQTRNMALLLNQADPFHVPLQRDVGAAAQAMRIESVPFLLKSASELPQAFDAMAGRGVDGVLVQPSLGIGRTAALALAHRLPAISFQRKFAVEGGLLSYGANPGDLYRTIADYVARILKGARPADLPVVMASRFELVINLRTAGALGLTFPPMLLATADEIIE
jgi:putative ABC transport system substrate-binding protein